LTLRGEAVSFITDFALQTDDQSLMGTYTLDCTFTLDNYATVQTVLPLTVTLYSLVPPATTPQDHYYTVNDAELIFQVD